MKLPRWLVVTLLTTSLAALLGLGAWWWITWPERTIRKFIDHVNAEELEDARRIIANEPIPLERTFRPLVADEDERGEPWTVEPQRRSLLDVLVGRQEFKKASHLSPLITHITRQGDNVSEGSVLVEGLVDPAGTFTVQRGSITTQWVPFTRQELLGSNMRRKKSLTRDAQTLLGTR
jgi:hypothetical protein